MAQRKYLNETGLSYFWGKIKGFFVKKSGDTMTGKLTLQSGQYSDAYNSGALDLKNSNIDGVNSIYTADSSDNAQEGIHFYRDSTHVDSLHAKAGVLYFTPNRALGSAGTPNEILVKGVSTFPEAYLTWGGRNHNASYGPIDAAMIGALGANRLELVKAAGIVVEYSRNNGSTWTDYGATDANKMKLMSSIGTSFYIGKYTSSDLGNVTTNWKLRVTLLFPAAGTYTTLNKFVFYVTTNGASSGVVTIDAQTKANENTDTWAVIANNIPISGWSGWNVINTGGVTTYSNNNAQYCKVRFTFGITNAASTTYSNALAITNILGFGGVGWATPNSIARYGHAYTYDENINVTFPAKVTAPDGSFTRINDVTVGSSPKFTDTTNTAGSTDTSSKIFLIGATSQAANPQTYSHDTAYVGTDGKLYSGSKVVLVGGSNASSTVSITPTTTDVYSMTSAGSVTAGTANVPTVINTSKFSGGSFSRGAFSQGTLPTLTFAMDATDTKKLKITFGQGTLPTHDADTFTAASLQSGFYTAGTANVPTAVTLPGRSSVIKAWTGYSAASAAAQTFTGSSS